MIKHFLHIFRFQFSTYIRYSIGLFWCFPDLHPVGLLALPDCVFKMAGRAAFVYFSQDCLSRLLPEAQYIGMHVHESTLYRETLIVLCWQKLIDQQVWK